MLQFPNARLKKITVILAVILIILLVLPYLVPLDFLKERIRLEAKTATGRELTIDGHVSLAIIPTPRVKISKIKLSSLAGAQMPTFAQIENISLALSLPKLLTGNIAFNTIYLDHPEINLEVLPSGKATWEMGDSSHDDKPLALPFSSLKIDSGKMTYYQGKVKTIIDAIDSHLTIASSKGPIDFTSSFRVNGTPLKLEGQIKELGKILPLSLNIEALGEKISLSGDFNLEQAAFKGLAKAKGSLSKFIPNLSKELQNNLEFSSAVAISKDKIQLDKVALAFGEISGSGSGNINLANKSADVNLLVNPGNVSISLTSQNFTSPDAGRINMHARNLKQLLTALAIETKNLPDFIAKDFTFATSAAYSDQAITLKNIDFTAGSTNLKGNLLIRDQGEGNSFEYDLSTSNAVNLAKLFKVQLPVQLDVAKIKGITQKAGDELQTTADLNAAWAETKIKGSVNLANQKIDMQVTSSGANFSKTYFDLLKSNALAGAGRFNFKINMQGDLSKALQVNMKDSAIDMGGQNVNLAGSYNLNVGKGQAKANLDVSADNIKLAGKNEPTPAASHRWSSDKIDLTSLASIDGIININIKQLIKEQLVFNNLKGKITVNKDGVNLESLSAIFEGGSLNAHGSINSTGDQALDLNAEVKNARLHNLVASKSFKITEGVLNLNVDLRSQGNSQLAYIKNLTGQINLDSSQGKISGFDLQKAKQTVLNLRTPESFLKLLDISFAGGETAYRNLVGRISVSKGIAKINEFRIDAGTDAKATAQGTVDLPNYNLDVSATVDVLVPNVPTFSISFYGPLDNPSRKLDARELQKHLFKSLVNNTIEQITKQKGAKPEDLLKGLLGLKKKP